MEPIHTHRVEVRFRDCDPLGHVNHAVYLTYLEQARFSHWRDVWGFESFAFGEDGPGVILVRAEVDYRAQVRPGDVLDVRIGLAAVGRTSFTYEYEILDPANRLVASARTVQVLFDYREAKAVPIPDYIRAKLAGRADGAPG
jgi:acyl-CoA thioester hydrolase